MARKARQAMADMRALEEEAERMNPVNPKKQLGSRKGYVGILRDPAVVVHGAGATPSMGLSTVRGGGATPSMGLSTVRGGMTRMVGAGLLGQDGHGQRVVGAGTKKGMMRKTARKAYEDVGRRSVALHKAEHRALEEEEAGSDEDLSGGASHGKLLAQRMIELHGRGFFDDFKKGFMSVISPIASVAKVALPFVAPGAGTVASGVLGALGAGMSGGSKEDVVQYILQEYGKGRTVRAFAKEVKERFGLSDAELKEAVDDAKDRYERGLEEVRASHMMSSLANPEATRRGIEDAEERISSARKLMAMREQPELAPAASALMKMKTGKGMSGGLRTGEYEGKGMCGGGFLSDLGIPVVSDLARAVGLGKKKRAKAGASDKRKARGAMVSKLMREEGMTLAEASKHIKAHGMA